MLKTTPVSPWADTPPIKIRPSNKMMLTFSTSRSHPLAVLYNIYELSPLVILINSTKKRFIPANNLPRAAALFRPVWPAQGANEKMSLTGIQFSPCAIIYSLSLPFWRLFFAEEVQFALHAAKHGVRAVFSLGIGASGGIAGEYFQPFLHPVDGVH